MKSSHQSDPPSPVSVTSLSAMLIWQCDPQHSQLERQQGGRPGFYAQLTAGSVPELEHFRDVPAAETGLLHSQDHKIQTEREVKRPL